MASMKRMQQSIRDAVAEVRTGSNELLESARALTVTSHQLATASDEQNLAAQETGEAVSRITARIGRIAESAKDAESTAKESGIRAPPQRGALWKLPDTSSGRRRFVAPRRSRTALPYRGRCSFLHRRTVEEPTKSEARPRDSTMVATRIHRDDASDPPSKSSSLGSPRHFGINPSFSPKSVFQGFAENHHAL